MARKRMIDPTIWADDGLGQLGLLERLMFIGLLTLADDNGISKGEAIYLKANLFPYDAFTAEEIEESRDKLVDRLDSLQFYLDENEREYIKFTKWNTYQKLSKPQPSSLPKPVFKKTAIPLSVRRGLATRHGLKKQGESKEIGCHWCKKNKGTINWMTPSWVHFKQLEMDHVIPESQGGKNLLENIVLSCRSCNRMRNNQVILKSESSNPPNRIEENRIEKNRTEEENLSDKNTSKNSITPCTPDELVEISETLKVPLDVVERKHQRILEMLETKEFNKRKYKTIFYTLKSWIDLDIQRGFIKKPMGVISI